MFVCFKGGMGTGACPGTPFCLSNVSVFAEDPQSWELPLHHKSELETRTNSITYFARFVFDLNLNIWKYLCPEIVEL